MNHTHPLPGLETDNLLGFLALLGLLRALEIEQPDWFPRAYFTGIPLGANLVLAADVPAADVAGAASAGCARLAPHFSFGEFRDLVFTGSEARQLMSEALAVDADAEIMSALCSDIAIRPKDGRIEPTALCALFGQGHQSFLDRLKTVSSGTLPGPLRSTKKPPDLNDPAFIARALFAPWERRDPTESFRWDFEEDRRYALRDVNPSGDAPTTEHGANRLAVLGLLSFQSAPIIRGSSVHLATRGVARHRRERSPVVTWPIWTRPATLAGIHSMMDDPELASRQPSFERLSRHGIIQVRRTTRYSAGKYLCFSRAVALG
jgi:hypothetical protein